VKRRQHIQSYAFLTLFNNTISVVFINYKKLHTLIPMVTTPTIVAVVKQWIQLWMHKYGFYCYTGMVWLPWFPNLTLDSPKLIGAGFAPTSEI
jgi:hypothetical protein